MSATFPAIVTSLRDMYAADRESTAQGLRVGVSGTSQAVFTMLAGFLVVLAWQYPFLTYNSLVVVRGVGASPGDAGLVAALFSAVYAGTATQAGRITGWADTRTVPLLAANACITAGLATFAFAPRLRVAEVGVVVLAVGVGVGAPRYRSLITGFGPERLRGGVVSVGESLGWVAVSFTPVVLGIAIGTLEHPLGTVAAVQWIGAGAGAASGLLGVACVAVAAGAPPVRGPQ